MVTAILSAAGCVPGWSDTTGCRCDAAAIEPDCQQIDASTRLAGDIRQWKRRQIESFMRSILPERRLSSDELDALLDQNFDLVRDIRPDPGPSIMNLANADPKLEFGSVGLLLIKGSGTGQDYFPHCTVILAQHDVVLTARHCINTNRDLKVYFPYEGLRNASREPESIFCSANDTPHGCNTTVDDLGFLRLDDSYNLLSPTKLAGATVPSGSEVTVAGFGYCYADGVGDLTFCGGNSSGNLGVLRQSVVNMANCGDCALASSDFREREVCFSHESSSGDLAVSALRGDSGGPMYILTAGNERQLVAVARSSGICESGTGLIRGKYVDALDDFYEQWMEESVFDLSGQGSSRGDSAWSELIKEPFAQLKPGDERVYALDVPADAVKILITLNSEAGEADDPVEFAVTLPPELSPDCTESEGIRGVEVCTISNPPKGCFDLHVKREDRFNAVRAFQMVAVGLGLGRTGPEER